MRWVVFNGMMSAGGLPSASAGGTLDGGGGPGRDIGLVLCGGTGPGAGGAPPTSASAGGNVEREKWKETAAEKGLEKDVKGGMEVDLKEAQEGPIYLTKLASAVDEHAFFTDGDMRMQAQLCGQQQQRAIQFQSSLKIPMDHLQHTRAL
ncbi:hypothetical protein CPC08DRAFT_767008 [Agrocybe pediades]|nr:hypothetical protein CPC08DRAFT_767008 [Agrocybe pediades]